VLFWYPVVTAGASPYIRSAVKIEAGAKGGKESAYIFYGLGAICLIAGLAMISRKGNLN
jgi:hypothetical protein